MRAPNDTKERPMLVPGLPITELAIDTVAANGGRPGAAARDPVQVRPEDFREMLHTWKARMLFAACYVFVVGLVVTAG